MTKPHDKAKVNPRDYNLCVKNNLKAEDTIQPTIKMQIIGDHA
jgi:hypothetical protein